MNLYSSFAAWLREHCDGCVFYALLAMFAVFLTLTGCAQRVESWELTDIEAKCAAHGGVAEIQTVMGALGVCRDGAFAKPRRGRE